MFMSFKTCEESVSQSKSQNLYHGRQGPHRLRCPEPPSQPALLLPSLWTPNPPKVLAPESLPCSFVAPCTSNSREALRQQDGDLALIPSLTPFPFISHYTGLWVAPINSCLEATNQPFSPRSFISCSLFSGAVGESRGHPPPQPTQSPDGECVCSELAGPGASCAIPQAPFPREEGHGVEGKVEGPGT